jgi:hypothetical protein
MKASLQTFHMLAVTLLAQTLIVHPTFADAMASMCLELARALTTAQFLVDDELCGHRRNPTPRRIQYLCAWHHHAYTNPCSAVKPITTTHSPQAAQGRALTKHRKPMPQGHLHPPPTYPSNSPSSRPITMLAPAPRFTHQCQAPDLYTKCRCLSHHLRILCPFNIAGHFRGVRQASSGALARQLLNLGK